MAKMETEFTILSLADLPRLMALVLPLKPQAEESYYTEALSRHDIDCILLSVNGVDVGWCLLNHQPKYHLYQRLGAPEIQDLNVRVEYRQQGFGSALIKECEVFAKHKGCSHIGISFGLTASYGAAQRLYIGLGYKPDGAGIMYDRQPVPYGTRCIADDDLTIMLVKELL